MNELDERPGRFRRACAAMFLAVAYFVALAPAAVLARVLRRDPLGRRLRERPGSLWQPRDEEPGGLEAARLPFTRRR